MDVHYFAAGGMMSGDMMEGPVEGAAGGMKALPRAAGRSGRAGGAGGAYGRSTPSDAAPAGRAGRRPRHGRASKAALRDLRELSPGQVALERRMELRRDRHEARQGLRSYVGRRRPDA